MLQSKPNTLFCACKGDKNTNLSTKCATVNDLASLTTCFTFSHQWPMNQFCVTDSQPSLHYLSVGMDTDHPTANGIASLS